MSFKGARKHAGMTLMEAAEKLNCNHATIVGWEKGKWMPRTGKLPEIAKIYGCTVDELLKGERKSEEA